MSSSKSLVAFRAPGSDDWRQLAESGEDNEKIEAAFRASEQLKSMMVGTLQMQNVVVLAGSGCSLSAGGPSMTDLWHKAIGSPPTAVARAISAQVNHDLEQDQNIEALLSRLEAYLQVIDDESCEEFLNASKQVILDECSSFLGTAQLEPHKTFLHRLSRRRVRDQRLRVFTTNYDLCFERAASELGGVALDGFSFSTPRRYDARYFGYDIIRRPRIGDDIGNYLEGVFLLYKLHGSVNWERDDGGAIYERDHPTPQKACLIYPARGKYQQSFLQPHLESMAQYFAAVREPNTCLIIVGFGFNDDHFAEPLVAAVQSNPHLRMIIVSPNLDTKADQPDGNRYLNRFSQLGKRGDDVWLIRAEFSDFAQIIPDLKSLTPTNTYGS